MSVQTSLRADFPSLVDNGDCPPGLGEGRRTPSHREIDALLLDRQWEGTKLFLGFLLLNCLQLSSIFAGGLFWSPSPESLSWGKRMPLLADSLVCSCVQPLLKSRTLPVQAGKFQEQLWLLLPTPVLYNMKNGDKRGRVCQVGGSNSRS